MPNLILKHSTQMAYFTDMRRVFDALPGVCVGHDWLISDLDCHLLNLDDDGDEQSLDPRLASGTVVITGRELDKILQTQTIQFNWAVFSGVPVGSRPNPSDAPYADGNPDFWHGSPKPQLTGAQLEIVCWDNCCCLLIGARKELAAKFRESFPEAVDLDDQNRSRLSSSY